MKKMKKIRLKVRPEERKLILIIVVSLLVFTSQVIVTVKSGNVNFFIADGIIVILIICLIDRSKRRMDRRKLNLSTSISKRQVINSLIILLITISIKTTLISF